MEQLQVTTKSKEYPVIIGEGIRHTIGRELSQLSKVGYSSILIITDDHVAPLYLEDVKNSLSNERKVFAYTIPSGEQSKSFQQYYEIQSFALEHGLDRQSLIIALGGGVVGDLAGFVAATYMRGIPFIQVPTTLLAHDSSVGGKVAINHPLGKNMIGAFHQPEAVIYDIETFSSLPLHEWRSGFAEVIKHALIWDRDFYEWLKTNITSFEEIRGALAEKLLLRSISIKAAVVAEDETEKGIRAYLNFGHTLAHAIETELGYGKITHGEAVVIGIIYAMRVSETVYNKSLPINEVKNWLETFSYLTSIPKELKKDTLLQTMKKDKKVQNGEIRMVLLQEIGKVEVHSVEEELLKHLLG